MVSNRRVLFLYKLEINRIERIYRFKRGFISSLPFLVKIVQSVAAGQAKNVPFPTTGNNSTGCQSVVFMAQE